MKFRSLLYPALFALTTFAGSHAAITTSGNFVSGSPTPTLSITQTFSLTVTTTTSLRYLIFDNWVTSDGAQSSALSTNPPTQFLFYTVNGGSEQQVAVSSLIDNFAGNANSLTTGDGLLTFNPLSVTSGQVLTFKAQSFTFTSAAGFNPNIPANFVGNVFATDLNGNSGTTSVAVPEPASALLGLVALPALLILRRKR